MPSESVTSETNPTPESKPSNPPASPVSATNVSQKNADSGLPQYDPLTPELVEEDAIRGDFAMRWAVVLIALLLGSTQIRETPTLVHVKTGQFLAGSGWLPPQTDPFAIAAADRSWVNLSWLFDHLSATLYSLGGWTGLSIFKAIAAGLIFGFLVHINRQRISTWWGSICAVIAAIACAPRLTFQPELFTLLGMACTLWILESWKQRATAANRIWYLIPLFLIWSNLDDRMFIGPLIVVLYGCGECLGGFIGHAGISSDPKRKTLWMAIGGSLVAATVHPFLWGWFTAPYHLFTVTLPAVRAYASSPTLFYLQYFPVASPQFFEQLDAPGVAALTLFGFALVSILLNWKRVDLGYVFVFFGISSLALLSIHELAVASLIFAVIATLNGQEWYASHFKQEYSTATMSLLLTRGGRALTVIGLFVLALLATSGRLRGLGTSGLGLDPEISDAIESFESTLAKTYNDQVFNFVLNQGDILIWTGKRPFIDQRVGLFAGRGKADLLALHARVRFSLRAPDPDSPGSGEAHVWKDAFSQNGAEIRCVAPRLTGRTPDYATLFDLLNSPDWELTHLGSATAAFLQKNSGGEKLEAFVKEHRADFSKLAFHDPLVALPPRGGWVELPTFYDRYFWSKPKRTSADVQLAMHLVRIAGSDQALRPDLAYLALRKILTGLSNHHNDGQAYLIQGDIYGYLARLEGLLQGPRQSELGRLRYFQAVMAYNQAVMIEPDDPRLHFALFNLYRSANKPDLALRELEIYTARVMELDSESDAAFKEQQQALDTLSQLRKINEEVDSNIKKALEAENPPAQIASALVSQGFVLKALQLIEQDPDYQKGTPSFPLQMMRTMLLLESGQLEAAYESAGLLEAAAEGTQYQDWRRPRALTLLANGEHERAAQIWLDNAELIERSAFAKLLAGLPARYTPGGVGPWPMPEILAAAEYQMQMPAQIGMLTLSAALIQMEAGLTDKAAQTLQNVLEKNPQSEQRPLIAYYLFWLTGEEIDPIPPADQMPILFAEEESQQEPEPENPVVEPAPGEEAAPTKDL